MQRSVGISILFTFITCGIYGIYWFFKLTEEIGELSGDDSISPGMAILFTLLTCGIYMVYWSYKMGKLQMQAQENKGIRASDDSLLFLILSLVGLEIVVYAIIQSNINKLVIS